MSNRREVPAAVSVLAGMLLVMWLLLSAFGCASSWSPSERAALYAYTLASVADTAQTAGALRRGAAELNPIYGSDPGAARLIGTRLLALAVVAMAVDHLDSPRARRALLWGLCGVEVGAIGWEASR